MSKDKEEGKNKGEQGVETDSMQSFHGLLPPTGSEETALELHRWTRQARFGGTRERKTWGDGNTGVKEEDWTRQP
jgi:hypothetical protein